MRWAVLGLVALIVVGNGLLLGASAWARHTSPSQSIALPGVPNLARVDDRLWRGGLPSDVGYHLLATRGVTTVVDLAAGDRSDEDDALLDRLGIREVELPIVDGTLPSRAQVARFLEVVRSSPGLVFLHCRAGVGRTGTLAAAYLVATGQADPGEALRRNLVVGPPSLEQVVFVARLGHDLNRRPPPFVTAASRLIDGPRRLWGLLRT